MAPMIGRKIDSYVIKSPLGKGGMGFVYKAADTRTDDLVVLKFIREELLESETAKTRFKNEAKAQEVIRHPNICKVYHIDESDQGELYIVMEFCRGLNLRRFIESGPMSVDRSIQVSMQIAHALAAAHAQHIVHRDIKPENIIITPHGDIKILDFGLAKFLDASAVTRLGTFVGTTGYMAPEQVQGLAIDHRTDIWGLGVLLYEMLSGERPFPGTNPLGVMHHIVKTAHTPLLDLQPDIPKPLGALCDVLLEKHPSNRPQNMLEALQHLEKIRCTLNVHPPNLPTTLNKPFSAESPAFHCRLWSAIQTFFRFK